MNTETLKISKNAHKLNGFTFEDVGDEHLFTGLETPMKKDAFKLCDAEKKELENTYALPSAFEIFRKIL